MKLLLTLTAITLLTSSCVPAVLGIKEISTNNTKIKFITGADFSVAASGTDELTNTRAIVSSRD